jgi:hypothetical protein
MNTMLGIDGILKNLAQPCWKILNSCFAIVGARGKQSKNRLYSRGKEIQRASKS